MSHLVQRRSQADLVENLKSGWMNRITAEFTVEILVHFEERYGDASARKEKSEHGSGWTATNNAARSVLNIADFVLMGLEVGSGGG